MLWEIEIAPSGHDAERDRVVEDYNLLNHSQIGAKILTGKLPVDILSRVRLSRSRLKR